MGISALRDFCREILETRRKGSKADKRIYFEAAVKLLANEDWYYIDMFGVTKTPPTPRVIKRLLGQFAHWAIYEDDQPLYFGIKVVELFVQAGIIEPHLVFPNGRFETIYFLEENIFEYQLEGGYEDPTETLRL